MIYRYVLSELGFSCISFGASSSCPMDDSSLRRALQWDNCGRQRRSRPLRPHHAVGDSGGKTGSTNDGQGVVREFK